jgi:5'-phosphate synthase pdxT subunit
VTNPSGSAAPSRPALGDPVIGVLALQGDVVEHVRALEANGTRALEVKTEGQLAAADALIIPGGESTTVIKLLNRFGLVGPIKARVHAGMPLWGTCMGMIVAAHDVAGLDQETLDLIDITVRRNAFGRQIASAEVALDIPVLGSAPFPAVFIRAPWIERAGPGVEVLAAHEGHGVFVRQGHVMATSFHPELTGDNRVHAYFARIVADAQTLIAKAS